HVAFALADHRHVECAGCDGPAERGGMPHDMGHPRARNLVLARQAGDIRARAADPFALDNRSALAGLGHMPSNELAPSATAEDQDFELFWIGHHLLLVCFRQSRIPPAETRSLCFGSCCGKWRFTPRLNRQPKRLRMQTKPTRSSAMIGLANPTRFLSLVGRIVPWLAAATA